MLEQLPKAFESMLESGHDDHALNANEGGLLKVVGLGGMIMVGALLKSATGGDMEISPRSGTTSFKVEVFSSSMKIRCPRDICGECRMCGS